jgi:hypothetical protein
MMLAVVMFLTSGGVIMYAFDRWVTNWVSMPVMLILSGAVVMFGGWLWMTIVAFIENMVHGIILLVFGPYTIAPFVYGFMKMDALMWALLMWSFGALMFIGGWVALGLSGG